MPWGKYNDLNLNLNLKYEEDQAGGHLERKCVWGKNLFYLKKNFYLANNSVLAVDINIHHFQLNQRNIY